jgi:hypothetical protein
MLRRSPKLANPADRNAWPPSGEPVRGSSGVSAAFTGRGRGSLGLGFRGCSSLLFARKAGSQFTWAQTLSRLPRMGTPFDESDFVDGDYQSNKQSVAAAPAAVAGDSGLALSTSVGTSRPPTREELDARVGEAQRRLEELKRAQEQLQRERAALEEAKRRRVEFQTGKSEMVEQLLRGVGLLEEAEFKLRQESDAMARSLAGLRDALSKVEPLNEESWTQENWNTELTRALTTIENARLEWNSARLKWPLLSGPQEPGPKAESPEPLWAGRSFGDLCRIGFALNWPVAAAALVGCGILLVLLLRR